MVWLRGEINLSLQKLILYNNLDLYSIKRQELTYDNATSVITYQIKMNNILKPQKPDSSWLGMTW